MHFKLREIVAEVPGTAAQVFYTARETSNACSYGPNGCGGTVLSISLDNLSTRTQLEPLAILEKEPKATCVAHQGKLMATATLAAGML